MIWDFDSTLLNVHSEKEDVAPDQNRGFVFNALAVWGTPPAEPLAVMLRPGDAALGNTDDRLELLKQAVHAVPPEYGLGHEEGDDPSLIVHLSRSGPIQPGPHIASSGPSQVPTSSIRLAFHQRFCRDALLLAREEGVWATERGGAEAAPRSSSSADCASSRAGPPTCELSAVGSARTRAHRPRLRHRWRRARQTCVMTNLEGNDIETGRVLAALFAPYAFIPPSSGRHTIRRHRNHNTGGRMKDRG